MQKRKLKKIKSIIIFMAILVLPNFAWAAISFDGSGKWETTFDCVDWTYTPSTTYPTNCNNIEFGGSPERGSIDGVPGTFPTTPTTLISAANNPGGAGGKGVRFWHRHGSNELSSSLKVIFVDQKEFWIRWYQRYEAGYAPDFTSLPTSWYHKQLYIQQTDPANTPNIAVIPEWQGTDSFRATTQGKSIANSHYLYYDQVISGNGGSGGYGWNTVYGSNVSDGSWHCFEVHLKMDTTATDGYEIYDRPNPEDARYITTPGLDGVGQIWIDGNLISNESHINFSAGELVMKNNGWDKILFTSNHSALLNTDREMYVDYDDMVIYNTTPPNLDAGGNAFIGPIGYGDFTAPSAPSGLSVM